MHQATFFCFYQGTVTSVGLVASPPLQKPSPLSPNSHGEKPLFVPGRPGDGALEKQWKTHAMEQELELGVWEKGGTKKGKLVGATNNSGVKCFILFPLFPHNFFWRRRKRALASGNIFLVKMLWDEDKTSFVLQRSLYPQRGGCGFRPRFLGVLGRVVVRVGAGKVV